MFPATIELHPNLERGAHIHLPNERSPGSTAIMTLLWSERVRDNAENARQRPRLLVRRGLSERESTYRKLSLWNLTTGVSSQIFSSRRKRRSSSIGPKAKAKLWITPQGCHQTQPRGIGALKNRCRPDFPSILKLQLLTLNSGSKPQLLRLPQHPRRLL